MLSALTQSGMANPIRARNRMRSYGGRKQWVLDVPSGMGTAVDFSFGLPGVGSISMQAPDGTSFGGNVRGAGAIDFQVSRSAPDQIVSGAESLGFGHGNTVSGRYGLCGGIASTLTADYSFCLGLTTNVTGQTSFGMGGGTASGTGTFSFGGGTASYLGAWAVGPANAPLHTQVSFAPLAANFASSGDCQRSNLIYGVTTTDATPTNVYAYSGGKITVPANTSWGFWIEITARTNSSGAQRAKFIRSGLISRNVGVATTVLDGSADTIGTDKGSNAGSPPAGWAVTIAADTTNGALDIKVTGAAATTIRWTVNIRMIETGYP